MIPTLATFLRRTLNSLHYRAKRLIICDFKCQVPRWKLNRDLKRATPKQCGRYSIASTTIKICRNKNPEVLERIIHQNIFFERRSPTSAKFFDNLSKKIGRQALNNGLNHISNPGPSYGLNLSDNAIRVLLKAAYFNF